MEEQISTRSKLEITPRLIKAKLKTAFSCFIDGIVEIMFCDRVNSSAIKMDETKTMEQQQLYLKIFIFYYQTICRLSDFVMHENFFSNLDNLGSYNENLISKGQKFCIAKFSLVGVCKSTDEMIPYEPFDGLIGRRP